MRDRQRSIYLPPWRVDVTIRPGVERVVPIVLLARAMAAALEAGGAPRPASLGLILSDDRELAELNAEHLGGSGPTDVLSFPLLPPGAFPTHAGRRPELAVGEAVEFSLPPGARPHLGDVVVSVERALEQATGGRGGWTGDRHWAPGDELLLLVSHGTLHVCGWDHAEPAEEAAMRDLERRLLSSGPA